MAAAEVPKSAAAWLDALNELPEEELHDLSGPTKNLKAQVPLEDLVKDASEGAAAQQPARPQFMKPTDFENTPMEQVAKPKGAFLPGVTPSRAEQARENETEEARKQEPLPPIPGANGVMTVEEAYDFLGVTRWLAAHSAFSLGVE